MEITSLEQLQKLAVSGFDDWKALGEVRVAKRGDYLLFSYLPTAQYIGRWNFFERISRGLIMHKITGEVIARPFDKFFNWLEGGHCTEAHVVEVTEKVDGSLGIGYWDELDQDWRIATRGSFDGEQAQWATKFLRDNFCLDGLEDVTPLFEIVYPENRIVVDYGARQDLVLLGMRDRFTGKDYEFYPYVYEVAQRYGFNTPKTYAFNSWQQVMDAKDQLSANEEGFVVRFSDGQRFKFKGFRYLELHKALSGLTIKRTFEVWRAGNIEEFILDLPDEFRPQVEAWRKQFDGQVNEIKLAVEAAFSQAPKENRKAFAKWVMDNHKSLAGMLFKRLDGEDYVCLIQQIIKDSI